MATATRRVKKTNKKSLVRDKAAQLFMERGYRGTTMDQVAEAAGLNKGTLYFYYKSKSEILFEIYDLCGTLIVGRTMVDESLGSEDAIRALVKGIVQTICEHPVETSIYFQLEPWIQDTLEPEQLASVRTKQKAVWQNCKKVFEKAKKESVLRNVAVEDCFHVLLGTTSWVHRWIKPNSSADNISERLSDILLSGICAQ